MLELLAVFAPFVFPIVAAFLLWLGLHHPKINLIPIIVALILLILVGVLFAKQTREIEDGGLLALFYLLIVGILSLVAGVTLAVFLNGKRKLVSLVMAVLFPVALFYSITKSMPYSPGVLRNDYGLSIAQSIEQFHADNGAYPETLQQLVPTYLDELRDSGTMWGWLYEVTDDSFSFGYVSGVERFGYFVYAYNPDTKDWDFLAPFENIFDIPPTPGSPIFPQSTIQG